MPCPHAGFSSNRSESVESKAMRDLRTRLRAAVVFCAAGEPVFGASLCLCPVAWRSEGERYPKVWACMQRSFSAGENDAGLSLSSCCISVSVAFQHQHSLALASTLSVGASLRYGVTFVFGRVSGSAGAGEAGQQSRGFCAACSPAQARSTSVAPTGVEGDSARHVPCYSRPLTERKHETI